MRTKSGLTNVTDEIKSTLDQLFQFVFWSVEKAWKHFHEEQFKSSKIPVASVLHAIALASTLKKNLQKYDILHGKKKWEWCYVVANNTVFTQCHILHTWVQNTNLATILGTNSISFAPHVAPWDHPAPIVIGWISHDDHH